MVWLKTTEIMERKRGFKSVAGMFDEKLNEMKSEQDVIFEKLEKIIDKKKKLIEKLEDKITNLEKNGKQAENEWYQLVTIKEKFECDVCKCEEILNNKQEIINVSQFMESEQFGNYLTSGVKTLSRNIF